MNERKRKTFFFHNRAGRRGFDGKKKPTRKVRFGQRVTFLSLSSSLARSPNIVLFDSLFYYLFGLSHFFHSVSTMCARRKEISLGLGHGPITATWRVVVGVALLRYFYFSPVGASNSSSANRFYTLSSNPTVG
jgi:hypothetical protein